MPAPTAWPLVLASGCTLMFAGLLTDASISILGVVLAVVGCVGWFREVFPHEHEEPVLVAPEVHRVTTERRVVERVPVAADQLRAWLPVQTYPVSAGVKGGLAGSVAMAVAGVLYGLLSGQHLVSDQPACGRILSRVSRARTGAARRISRGQLAIASGDPRWSPRCWWACSTARCCRCFPRRPIVAGRRDRTDLVVRSAVLRPRTHQSGHEPTYRLALVRGVPDRFRHRRRARGVTPGSVSRRWNLFALAVRAGIEAPGMPSRRNGEDAR